MRVGETWSTDETRAYLEHLYDAWRDFVHFGPFALSAEGMGIGKAFGAGDRIPGLQSIRVFKALGGIHRDSNQKQISTTCIISCRLQNPPGCVGSRGIYKHGWTRI